VTDLLRRTASEALGAALLVATVVGSGIMAERLTDDTALMLLANSFATGAILVVLIGILAPVSGAHLNPVVTLVMLVRKEFRVGAAVAYIAAQIAGAVAGTILAHAMFALPLLEVGTHERTGWSQWLAEAVAAFGLVLVILAALRARAPVGWHVGLYIVAAYWFTASTSFANPAVTIARALTDTFTGIRPADVPGFIAAQCVGALLAAMLAGWMLAPERR
jgi:glycerol uptake facilitator-like aquaporin